METGLLNIQLCLFKIFHEISDENDIHREEKLRLISVYVFAKKWRVIDQDFEGVIPVRKFIDLLKDMPWPIGLNNCLENEHKDNLNRNTFILAHGRTDLTVSDPTYAFGYNCNGCGVFEPSYPVQHCRTCCDDFCGNCKPLVNKVTVTFFFQHKIKNPFARFSLSFLKYTK